MYKRSRPDALNFATVKNIVDYFNGIEGVNMTRVMRNSPYIISLRKEDLDIFRENRSRVIESLGLSDKEMGKILSANAYVLSRPFDVAVKPCLEYLQEKGFDHREIRSMVVRFPRMLLLSNDRLKLAENSLGEMGIGGDKFKRMLWKFPAISTLTKVMP